MSHGLTMSQKPEASDTKGNVEQRFIASVSHEIRTPLNGILGMASLLSETELSPAQADYVTAIRQSGARLLDLLNNVLDYARMDAAGIELELSDVDLIQLAQDVAELLSPRAHERGLDICVRSTPGFPTKVKLDDGRMRQILFNLVGNAIKFTETGGVMIDLAETSTGVCLKVVDSGPGLSQSEQVELFSAFRQADASHRGIDGGVGLGLTIVKRLIDAMGGDIRLISEKDWGANFEIHLPVEHQVPESESPECAAKLKPLNVGLIGLSPPLSLSLSAMLHEAGHIPLIGEHGRKIDLWIADASLAPGRIKALAGSAPLITLIRPEDRSQIDALRNFGSIAYLMRPLRPASLIARLDALHRNGSFTGNDEENANTDEENVSAAVLIADDNQVNALLATRTLEKIGYKCITAATGAEAVEAVQMQDFDLVLMDLRMPVMDGFEAMRQIRGLDSPKARVPMIAISAEVNPETERKARNSGADAVASKPLDAQTLRTLANTWRRKAEHA